jgi:hypothetical protein
MTNTQSSPPFTAAERLRQACDLVVEGEDVSRVWIVYPDRQATLQVQKGGADLWASDVEIRIDAPGEISVLPKPLPSVDLLRPERHFRWRYFAGLAGLREGTR